MTLNNHRIFYNDVENKRSISKNDITNGMIINFRYNTGSDKNPLVFVLDTQIGKGSNKRSFSGINLNYLSVSQINRFFLRLLSRVGWEYDKKTNMYRVEILDEGATKGINPLQIYESLVKPQLVSNTNCWRIYKHSKITAIHQIRFDFEIPPLNKIRDLGGDVKTISKSDLYRQLRETGNEN